MDKIKNYSQYHGDPRNKNNPFETAVTWTSKPIAATELSDNNLQSQLKLVHELLSDAAGDYQLCDYKKAADSVQMAIKHIARIRRNDDTHYDWPQDQQNSAPYNYKMNFLSLESYLEDVLIILQEQAQEENRDSVDPLF